MITLLVTFFRYSKKFILAILLVILLQVNISKVNALNLEIEVLSNNYTPSNMLISEFTTTKDTIKYYKQLKDIIIADLEGSGVFLIRSTLDSLLEDEDNVLSNIKDIDNYSNYDAILLGKFIYDKNNKEYIIEYAIFNNFTKEINVKYGYKIPRKSIGREISIVAHDIANDYFNAITGKDGYFNAALLYAENNRLMIADYDGKNSQLLVSNKGKIYGPVSSNKGDVIAYVNFEDGLSSIYIYNVSSKTNIKMADLKGLSLSPRFSRDDKELIFSQVRQGSTNIFKIDLTSYKVSMLTNSYTINLSGGYSVDNSKIVFYSDRLGMPHIYTMDNNGKNVQRLSKGNGSYYTPSFAYNSDIILFTKVVSAKFYIGLLSLDGKEKIIAEDLFVESPSWLNDDRHVIYQYKYSGDNYAFYIMDLLSGYKKQIIPSKNSLYPYIAQNIVFYNKNSVKYML